MTAFRDAWVKKNLPEEVKNPPMFPMYGIGESVMYGGFRYAVTDFHLDDTDNCWAYDLVRLDGSDEKQSDILEPGLCKSQVFAKPGASIHTKKWDDCVQHVKDHGGSANAYAVCTAMLGEDSFKSIEGEDFLVKVDEYIDRLGITAGVKAASVGTGFAGPVPNSLLARQDLEGRSEKVAKSSEYRLDPPSNRRQGQNDGERYARKDAGVFVPHEDILTELMSLHALDYPTANGVLNTVMACMGKVAKTGSEHDMTIEIHNGSETTKDAGDSVYVCFTDENGNEQERAFSNKADAEAFMESVKPLKYTGVRMEMRKGRVEEAKKDLIEMAEDPTASKSDLARNIKEVQLKGQKATIDARQRAGEAKGKSFGDVWRGL